MELTRREAVAALGAAGLTVGGAVLYNERTGDELLGSEAIDEDAFDLVFALAEVVYPSDVTVTEEFLETYLFGRIRDDSAYEDAIVEAASALNDRANERTDEDFADLSISQRDDLLAGLEMSSVDPDPEGTERERIRYYLVNELLFALFTTPKGGELVGAENPTGYPGGLEAYQRGPQA